MNIKVIGMGVIAWVVIFGVFALSLKGLVDWKLLEARNVGVAVIAASIFMLFLPKLLSIITDEEEFSSSMMIVSMLVGCAVIVALSHSFMYSLLFIGFVKGLEACGLFKAMYRGIGNMLGAGYVAVAGKKTKKRYI